MNLIVCETLGRVNVRFIGNVVVPARVGLGHDRESDRATLSLPDQSWVGGPPKCGRSDYVLSTRKTKSAE